MYITIINGPNLNLLGKRESHIYGSESFESYLEKLTSAFPDLDIRYFQSNHEGALIDKIHEVGFDDTGIVMNPGALSHYSLSLADAIAAVEVPVVEVHISNIKRREAFRQRSVTRDYCVHFIHGKGLVGYRLAVEFLQAML